MTRDQFEQLLQPIPFSGCWLWDGNVNRSGYGYLHVQALHTQARAHRLSYNLYKGYIPDDLYVLHTCDVKTCVNPNHLYLGTAADNMGDLLARGIAGRKIQSACQRGHPMMEGNIYFGSKGRQCLTCKRDQGRKWKILSRLGKLGE